MNVLTCVYIAAISVFASSSFGVCTDAEIWAVFPTTAEAGGVSENLRNDFNSTTANGDRSYDRRWDGGSSSRSLSISLTIHGSAAEAAKRVNDYGQAGSGIQSIAIGDAGYWTADLKRPYYLICRKQFSISLFSRTPRSGFVGPQDHLLKMMIKRIDALSCVTGGGTGGTVHTISMSGPTASANPIASGGTVTLSVSASDSQGHGLSYLWMEKGKKGKIHSPKLARTQWTAPSNTTAATIDVELSCTVTCKHSQPETAGKSIKLQVLPQGSEVEFTTLPTAGQGIVTPGTKVSCVAAAKCNLGHTPVTYAWVCTGGSFDSAVAQNPTWLAPALAGSGSVTHTLTCTATCANGIKTSASAKQVVGEGLVLTVKSPVQAVYITGQEIVLPGTLTFAGQPVDGADIQVKINSSAGGKPLNAGAVSDGKGDFTIKEMVDALDVGTKGVETWTFTILADAPDPKLKPVSTKVIVSVCPVVLKLHDAKLVQVVEVPETGTAHVTFGKPLYARVYVSCPSLKGVKGVLPAKVNVQLDMGTGPQSTSVAGYPVSKTVEVGADVVEVDFLGPDFPLAPAPGSYGVGVIVDPDGLYTKPTLTNALMKSYGITVRRVKPFRILIVPIELPLGSAAEKIAFRAFCRKQVSFMREVYPQAAGGIMADELQFPLYPHVPVLSDVPWWVPLFPLSAGMATRDYSLVMMMKLTVLGSMLDYDRVIGVGPKSAHWWAGFGFQAEFPYIFGDVSGIAYPYQPSALAKYGCTYEVFSHEIGHTFGLNPRVEGEEYALIKPNGKRISTGLVSKNGRICDLENRTDMLELFGNKFAVLGCFMGRSIGDGTPGWVCKKSYGELFPNVTPRALPRSVSPAQERSVLLVGRVDTSGVVSLQKTLCATVSPALPHKGIYTVECISDTGQPLFSCTFGDGSATSELFCFVIPYPKGSASIQFRKGSRILNTFSPGMNAPHVRILSPSGGAHIEDKVRIEWSATDPDGDALDYTVFYSTDQGASWALLAVDEKGTSLNADLSGLPGGQRCIVKVIANDGFNITEAISEAPFTVVDRPPLVSITFPTNGMTLAVGTTQTTYAVAYDLETGPLSAANTTWQSDRDGVLGVGEQVSLSKLSEGTHTITASIVDAAGSVGRESVTVDMVAGIQSLEVAANTPFELRTPLKSESEILLGKTSDSSKANIYLRLRPPRNLAMNYAGRWMSVGGVGAYGRSIQLKHASVDQNTLVWTFVHTLRAGDKMNAYLKADGKWKPIAAIVCP